MNNTDWFERPFFLVQITKGGKLTDSFKTEQMSQIIFGTSFRDISLIRKHLKFKAKIPKEKCLKDCGKEIFFIERFSFRKNVFM